jgi:hypothetical protein
MVVWLGADLASLTATPAGGCGIGGGTGKAAACTLASQATSLPLPFAQGTGSKGRD